MSLPLAGRRVLVTRSAHQASKLSDALRDLGAEPVEVPVLEIQPPESFAALDGGLRKFDAYNWLIFTSANTVRALVERSAAIGISMEQAAMPQVAAVGEATASAARNAGFTVALVPEKYIAESLIEELLEHGGHVLERGGNVLEHGGHVLEHGGHVLERGGNVSGHDFSRAEEGKKKARALALARNLSGLRVLLARAEIARDVIPDALRAAGAQVDVVDAYRNLLPESAPEKLRKALEGKIDAATFTSSSSVTHLKEAAEKAGIAFPFSGVPAISIGPITSATLRENGWAPAAEATRSDIAGLVEAVERVFRS
jgi:uroporphyrinogen-III synthase